MSCLKRALRRSPARSICQRVPPLEAVSSRNAVYTAVSERQGVVTSDELSAAEREQLDKEVAALSKQMDELWKTRADQKDWDTVKALKMPQPIHLVPPETSILTEPLMCR